MYTLDRENKARDAGHRDEQIVGEGKEALGAKGSPNGTYATIDDARRDKGDKWSGYRYIL